jgi:hypothetical protein
MGNESAFMLRFASITGKWLVKASPVFILKTKNTGNIFQREGKLREENPRRDKK